MTEELVAQLTDGIIMRVDGQRVVCKPLTLKLAKELQPLIDRTADAKLSAVERGEARLAVVRIFSDAYPELATVLSPGDVFKLLPDFFWAETDAVVVRPPGPNSGLPTPPPTAPAPTP